MSAQLDERIRQVAIVLSSVDAHTAQELLAELPPEHARLVRRAHAKLGHISESERRNALNSLRSRVTDRDFAEPMNSTSTSNSDFASDRSDRNSANKANQPNRMTASQVRDLDLNAIAMEFLNEDAEGDDVSSIAVHDDSVCIQTPPAISTSHNASLHELVVALDQNDIRQLFAAEQPAVVAILIQQVDDTAAAKILQALPQPLAVATLAQLPQVKSVRTEVLDELRNMILDHTNQNGAVTSPAMSGLDRVKSILAVSTTAPREQWLNELSKIDHQLATCVGWQPDVETTLASRNIQSEARSENPLDAVDQHLGDSSSHLLSIENIAPLVLGQQSVPAAAQSARAERDRVVTMSYEQICSLRNEDLSQVVQNCEPNAVLVLLTLTGEVFYQRVIPMFTSRDIQRIKDRLNQLEFVGPGEIEQAKQKLCHVAGELFSQGKIGTLYNLTITAAA
jgi:flagellar motor switch protein FliG